MSDSGVISRPGERLPPVREIGRVFDSNGMDLVVGVDFGRVTIGHDQMEAFELGADAREEFSRLYFEAERQAEASDGRNG